jgi:hypothetical protein
MTIAKNPAYMGEFAVDNPPSNETLVDTPVIEGGAWACTNEKDSTAANNANTDR